jgi:hypothetical protein
MGFLDSALASNGARLTESSAYSLGADDPDRQDNLNNGFRRLLLRHQ